MITVDDTPGRAFAPPVARTSGHAQAALIGDLLPLCDVACILVAASLCTLPYAHGFTPALMDGTARALHRAMLVATVLAPFALYDKRFGLLAGGQRPRALMRAHALRYLVFAGAALAVAAVSGTLHVIPGTLLMLWACASLLLTALARVVASRLLRRRLRHVVPNLTRIDRRSVGYVGGGVPVRVLADRPINQWGAVIKWAEDYLLAAVLTVLLLPMLALIAAAVGLSGPGPIIFKQRRHALDNRDIDIYKFRTMHWNPFAGAETLRQTSRQDARVTRVGRFLRSSSLDELPQLFNVLKGDMSLVGPRPHAVNMRTEDRLGCEITDSYAHRHRVKPGITGWAQVNGARGATDTTAQLRRRVELDLYYIDHWSLLFDLSILLLTCRAVVRATRAY
jgi:lipopolysaccharide/colanic/teichoic acid biosynthesis glycosyltransferase